MESLINVKRTLMISSIDKNGEPFISYSTYIMMDNELYIYISKTAPHYENIQNNKIVDVMIIEDENEAASLFARSRVSFKCIAEKLEEGTKDILNEFSKIHGSNLMNTLVKLDFNIFKLTIKRGRLVKGFGKAYDIAIEQGELITKQLDARDVKGHKEN